MLDIIAFLLTLGSLGVALSFSVAFLHRAIPFSRLRASAAPGIVALAAFVGCVLVAFVVRQPTPRIDDEFSYLLMGEMFAHGHIANPTPPLPEFFDTFHELVRPVYVSKYFPVQGIFLAIGQKLVDRHFGSVLGHYLAFLAS
jgi:hypothetical protein